MVTGLDMGDAHTHRFHDPRALMAQHHRNGEGYGPVHHGQVAVAQPGRGDRDLHLAGPWIPYLQIVHDLGLLTVEDHAPHQTRHRSAPYPLGSFGRPSTRSAMIVRWISSEPP